MESKLFGQQIFFGFCFGGGKKISIASSLSANCIPKDKEEFYYRMLSDYTAISIRESTCKKQLEKITSKKVSCVLDPTLILGYDYWRKVMEEVTDNKYLLTYFIGKNRCYRFASKEFASNNNIKWYNYPQMSGTFAKADYRADAIDLYDVSPFQWIGYINNAQYIISDSFHMTAFAIMFHKNFLVLEKDSGGSQNLRITSLLTAVGLRNRFTDFTNIDRLLEPINWDNVDKLLKDELIKSNNFLNFAIDNKR